jgi:hypothetical protein
MRCSDVTEQSSTDVIGSIALTMGSIPEVEAVFTQSENNVVRVWTIISGSDRLVKRRIYGNERSIIEMNGSIAFEFSVISGQDRDPRMFLGEEMDVAYIRA